MSNFDALIKQIDERISPYELHEPLLASIAARAGRYGMPYMLAFASTVGLHFYQSFFVRWAVGGLLLICLGCAWKMMLTLSTLWQTQVAIGVPSRVGGNHLLLSVVAFACVIYAGLAVYLRWSLPSLATAIALFIDFVHFACYRGITDRWMRAQLQEPHNESASAAS